MNVRIIHCNLKIHRTDSCALVTNASDDPLSPETLVFSECLQRHTIKISPYYNVGQINDLIISPKEGPFC